MASAVASNCFTKRRTFPANRDCTRGAVSIFEPNPRDVVKGYSPSRSLADSDGSTRSVAAYANDNVDVGTRWLFSGGFRVERYDTTYKAIDATGATTTDLRAHGTLTSGRTSVLFRLNGASNLYASYGTTVTPPGEANFQLSATANNVNNPNLTPQRSANLEAGTKIEVHDGRLAITGAVFRTHNRNVIYTIDATAVPPLFNQDDEQVVRGASVGALGQISRRWQLLANLGYLDARLRSQGINDGHRLTLTPEWSGSVWSTVRLAQLSVGGGVQYVGAAYADTANTIRVPAHTVADGVVEYGVNAHLSLRLNINNLTDTVYVKSVNNNGGRYNPGERRSVLATTTVRF
ncbi:MAG: TonB-dependent receptor [Vicinamibacterales bacterium]